MPPKRTCALKAINNSQKDALEKTEAPKKKKMVKEQEDKASGCDSILENWSETLEKALTAKHQKTIIKMLASNADTAVEYLSIDELRRALWTSSFLTVPEGQKFCARALPKIGIKASYYLIKKAIIEEKSTKQTWDSYGELIGTAWKYYNKENEDVCQEIEDEIMKGLFHDAIMLADALSEKFMHTLIAFKGATCSFKAKMDNMLYESARVVLWRGCEAPNNRVRYRACKVLMEFFPWRPSTVDELQRASQNQHSNFVKMLKDPCSEIRKETAYKVLKICAQYWSYIPSYGKRQYLAIICDELILDADPSVRLSVIEGMTYMVMESICLNAAESALKCVCPVAIYDKNERVRLETFKLLRKLIPNRFLKYWSIVPIDKIMGCLEAETSESVKKEIVQLVFTSFYQKDENANETLKRLNYLSKYGRNAALTFYRLILPLKLISVDDAGAHLKDIALAVYKFASGNFSEDSKVFDDTIGSLAGPMGEISLNEQHPKWSRVKLFMDCTVVLYMMLLRDPKFDENRALKVKLEKVMTKVFKKMFQCFRETSALGTTMTLGSMLPQQTLAKENLISQILQHLNEETDNAVIMPYLEATMQWDAEPILQTISAGINVIANDVNMSSPSSKKNKAEKEVAPSKKVVKALYFLSYIISSLTAKAVLLNYYLLELQTFYKNMRPINKLIEERLAQATNQCNELYLDDDILLEVYIMKYTLICILLNAIKPERQAEDCLVYIKDLCDDAQWFEEHILSLSNKSQRNICNHEFFYKLSNVVLRKMCDVLMAWDFAGNIEQPEVNHNVHDTSTSMKETIENNFIESFKRIGYAFMRETTPSDCMPPVFNSARQLLILNPEDPNLSIATIMYAPTWVIERVDNGDELEDKQIGEQLFHLLKAVSETPDFFPKTYTHQLAQTLIDAMTWIIQDSSDCPDPREHNYEIPRFIEVLLFESIRRHVNLFRIFVAALKERVMSHDLFTGAEQQYADISKYTIDLWVLGACAQLTHICFLNPDVIQTKKKEAENAENDVIANDILTWLKKRVEEIEADDTSGTIDDLLATQIKSMLPS